VVVEAAVPGVPADKVEVEVEGDLITIRGKVEEEEKEEKKKTYYRKMEKRSFNYVTTSPRPIKGDRAKAEVKDGMVTVTIPKAEEAKKKLEEAGAKVEIGINEMKVSFHERIRATTVKNTAKYGIKKAMKQSIKKRKKIEGVYKFKEGDQEYSLTI